MYKMQIHLDSCDKCKEPDFTQYTKCIIKCCIIYAFLNDNLLKAI